MEGIVFIRILILFLLFVDSSILGMESLFEGKGAENQVEHTAEAKTDEETMIAERDEVIAQLKEIKRRGDSFEEFSAKHFSLPMYEQLKKLAELCGKKKTAVAALKNIQEQHSDAVLIEEENSKDACLHFEDQLIDDEDADAEAKAEINKIKKRELSNKSELALFFGAEISKLTKESTDLEELIAIEEGKLSNMGSSVVPVLSDDTAALAGVQAEFAAAQKDLAARVVEERELLEDFNSDDAVKKRRQTDLEIKKLLDTAVTWFQ